MNKEEVVPQLQALSKRIKNSMMREEIEQIADAMYHALEEAEEMRTAAREYATMTMRQRDALHELIKAYSKELDNIEVRNRIMKDANRVIKEVG